jgi:enterochelin esterase family protein
MRRLLVLLLVLAASPAAAEVRPGSFRSAALGREVGYVADLPASYAEGSRRYPVVYALHGLFEGSSFWERRGLAPILRQLAERNAVPEMIVVAVDGGNSFFVNAPGGAYEDLVTQDLVGHVEATYRVVPGRAGRALLGVSMGGYGALRIAFRHPEAFVAAATHSAMLLEKIPSREEGAGRWHMAAFNRVFGDPIDAELWAAADPLRLVEKADAKALPLLYLDCGSEDRFGLFAGNRSLHERLQARGVKHEFGLHPGDHGYEYVRSVLEHSLRFLGGALQPGGAKAPAAARN